MDDWVLAILLIAVGALLNLRGYVGMRVVFALWGALAGFGLGAGSAVYGVGEANREIKKKFGRIEGGDNGG